MKIAVTDKKLEAELISFCGDLEFSFGSDITDADIVVLTTDKCEQILQTVQALDQRPSLFLISEAEDLPKAYLEGKVDDILTAPLRRAEFLSRVRWHHHLQHLKEIENTSTGVPALLKKLEEDLLLAEKIQRRLIRDKFPPMTGLTVKSKYLVGMGSGGNYFDVIDFPGGQYVGVLLADSSSYSLSSNFLSAIMHQTLQIPEGQVPLPEAVMGKVVTELEFKEKDKLSIFFGILDRKTYSLNYAYSGNVWACCRKVDSSVHWITEKSLEPLTLQSRALQLSQNYRLDPEDRVVIFSNGWKDDLAEDFSNLFNSELRKMQDAQSFLNQLSFGLKKRLDSDDDENPMPSRDCSLLLLDVDKKVLRLAN